MGSPSRARAALELLLLFVVYVTLAKLGLMMDAVSGFATLVWPATGVAMAALLKLGPRRWPAIFAGAFVTNLWIGAPALAALGIAAGNTLEAVAGAWALRRLAGLDGAPERLRHVLGLVGLGAAGATLISAVAGVVSLRLGGVIPTAAMGGTFRAWWIGDAIGALVVAPLLLSWAVRERWPRGRRLVEACAITGGLAALSWLVFSGRLSSESAFGQVYLVFPLLLWAALRFHMRGATAATLLVSVVAVAGTALGRGPFVRATLSLSLLFLQVFIAMVAMTTLVVAAAIGERDRALGARDAMLALVSHDLKNPLGALTLQVQLLARRLPQETVASLERTIERMTLLVRDLLDGAALDAGELTLRPERMAVGALVAEVIDNLSAAAAARNQLLRAEVEEASLECDRGRVLQVLFNLADNALKYSPDGATVTLAAAPSPDGVRFSVRDPGPGIGADQLRHVFEPFWRGDRGRPGSGLGLSIANKIVQAHRGRMGVDSRVGEGSTFWFTLP